MVQPQIGKFQLPINHLFCLLQQITSVLLTTTLPSLPALHRLGGGGWWCKCRQAQLSSSEHPMPHRRSVRLQATEPRRALPRVGKLESKKAASISQPAGNREEEKGASSSPRCGFIELPLTRSAAPPLPSTESAVSKANMWWKLIQCWSVRLLLRSL